MQALVVDDKIKERIDAVVKFAELNVYSMDDLLDMMNEQKTIPGDIEGHVCHIPFGYRIVFSIENQVMGRVKHFTVSLEGNKYPSVESVKLLLPLFGIKAPLEKCVVEVKETPVVHINILSEE